MDRRIWIVLLAALVRAAYLFYNAVVVHMPPYWKWDARVGLVVAASDFGRIDPAFAAGQWHEASSYVTDWIRSDRGMVAPYWVFGRLFGTYDYLPVQILHHVLDIAMLAPVMDLGRRLGGGRVALLAGVLYALFIPQVFLATNPGYDTWLTFGFVVGTWLLVYIATERGASSNRLRRALIPGAVTGAAVALFNEIRSVISVYAVAMPLWFWFASRFRSRPQPRGSTTVPLLALAVAACVSIATTSGINLLVRGEATLTRSTLGHAFWTGVGQFANPFGLDGSDGSVGEFYFRETGRTDQEDTLGKEYNAWLRQRALAFVREMPGLYASQVARRAAKVVFFDDGLYLIADQAALAAADPAGREVERQARLDTVARHGLLSPAGIATLAALDPGYFLRGIVRVVLMVSLPLGVAAALVLSAQRWLVILASLPLAYALVTISPVYGPMLVDTSYYAALMPVVALGWCEISSLVGRLASSARVLAASEPRSAARYGVA